MKLIVLAGGGGTRLFPLSRTCMPKQFLKLGNSNSLLAQTVKRFLPLIKFNEIVVVTNKEYIPPSTKQRLENPGRLPLEIIEVQNGSYPEEDDIVRFGDVYGRA